MNAVLKRSVVTPGQLYRLLSAEFRARRPSRCLCRMPMIGFREPAAVGAANWGVESPRRGCLACAGVVMDVVASHALLYDIKSP